MSAALEPFLPYGRQQITDADVDAVASALRGQLITQGPTVERFEQAFAAFCGARHAIAFANGTAALHGAAAVAGLGEGDTLVTTPVTFVADANCALFVGARPRFGDVDPETGNLDLATAPLDGAKACIAVSLAGHPVDLQPLQERRRAGLVVIHDACHAVGGTSGGRPIGGEGTADMTVFSLHPVKSFTTGEGGLVATDDDGLAEALREFRTHGIRRGGDPDDVLKGGWHYDVATLGFNYRITDFQCALGLSQLERLPGFVERRNEVAEWYREDLAGLDGLRLPARVRDGDVHGQHLFVVRFPEGAERRRAVQEHLQASNIGTQLHYIPLYRHSLYRRLGYGDLVDQLTHAEAYYHEALSLPMYPDLGREDVRRVARELERALA